MNAAGCNFPRQQYLLQLIGFLRIFPLQIRSKRYLQFPLFPLHARARVKSRQLQRFRSSDVSAPQKREHVCLEFSVFCPLVLFCVSRLEIRSGFETRPLAHPTTPELHALHFLICFRASGKKLVCFAATRGNLLHPSHLDFCELALFQVCILGYRYLETHLFVPFMWTLETG